MTGADAFKKYMEDCDVHEIEPDVAGAFHWAWTNRHAAERDTVVHDKRCPAALNVSDPCKCGYGKPDTCQGCGGNGGSTTAGPCAECYGQGSYSGAREFLGPPLPPLPPIIPEGTPLAHAVREYARQAVYAALTPSPL